MHLRMFAVATAAILLVIPAHAQQSHWASADDKTAKYIIDMERKWAEGVCVNNGVVASLLADDFQGTSTKGAHFTKADELKDEKGARAAHDCGLDEAKVHFLGDNVAVVYGREHAIGKDKSQPSAKVCQVGTDTWLKRGGTSPRTIIAWNVRTDLSNFDSRSTSIARHLSCPTPSHG
jgi:hypothetical protein